MSTVHIALPLSDAAAESAGFAVVRGVIGDVLGRSSVPLLTVISGLLVARGLARRSWGALVRRRAAALLVPLAAWNLIAMLVAMGLGHAPPLSPLAWMNGLLALGGPGFMLPLTFLRDLFIVASCAPLIAWILRRTRGVAVLPIVVASFSLDLSPLLMRGPLLGFFTVGVLVAEFKVEDAFNDGRLRWFVSVSMGALLVLAAATPFAPWIRPISDNAMFDLVIRRPSVALAFWFVARALSRHWSVRAVVRRHLEPAIFLMFLSHGLAFRLLAGPLRLTEPLGPLAAMGLWLAFPLIGLALAVALERVLQRRPTLSRLLQGRVALGARGTARVVLLRGGAGTPVERGSEGPDRRELGRDSRLSGAVHRPRRVRARLAR